MPQNVTEKKSSQDTAACRQRIPFERNNLKNKH